MAEENKKETKKEPRKEAVVVTVITCLLLLLLVGVIWFSGIGRASAPSENAAQLCER